MRRLLDPETLADVSSVADRYWEGNYQLLLAFPLNISPEVTSSIATAIVLG